MYSPYSRAIFLLRKGWPTQNGFPVFRLVCLFVLICLERFFFCVCVVSLFCMCFVYFLVLVLCGIFWLWFCFVLREIKNMKLDG